MTVGAGTDEEWIYRREPSLRRPWDEAVLSSRSGVPYLAPELQLLFKSKDVRPKDQLDAEVVVPTLSESQRALLESWLPPDHPWTVLP